MGQDRELVKACKCLYIDIYIYIYDRFPLFTKLIWGCVFTMLYMLFLYRNSPKVLEDGITAVILMKLLLPEPKPRVCEEKQFKTTA